MVSFLLVFLHLGQLFKTKRAVKAESHPVVSRLQKRCVQTAAKTPVDGTARCAIYPGFCRTSETSAFIKRLPVGSNCHSKPSNEELTSICQSVEELV